MACVFEEGPDDRFETVACGVAGCGISRVARGDAWILDKDPSMGGCQEPAEVNFIRGEIMNEKVTPSVMPPRLHEGVIKLSEEELCKQRETVDALELLKRREASQAKHDERRAQRRAALTDRLTGEANKEALIARKNARKQKHMDKMRAKKRPRGKR